MTITPAVKIRIFFRPALDWVALAHGHGVPAATVRTADELVREAQRGFASGGPYLIEVVF